LPINMSVMRNLNTFLREKKVTELKLKTCPLCFAGGVKRMRATCEYVGLGKSKIYDLISKGEFPKPIPLGTPLAKGFLVAELNLWLEEQAAKRYEK